MAPHLLLVQLCYLSLPHGSCGQSVTVITFPTISQSWSFLSCAWLAPDVLSAGLDVGYALVSIVIFFALQYPKNGMTGLDTIQSWLGNTVYTKTSDYIGVPYETVPDGGTFGPTSW
jgi:hypothetical protein